MKNNPREYAICAELSLQVQSVLSAHLRCRAFRNNLPLSKTWRCRFGFKKTKSHSCPTPSLAVRLEQRDWKRDGEWRGNCGLYDNTKSWRKKVDRTEMTLMREPECSIIGTQAYGWICRKSTAKNSGWHIAYASVNTNRHHNIGQALMTVRTKIGWGRQSRQEMPVPMEVVKVLMSWTLSHCSCVARHYDVRNILPRRLDFCHFQKSLVISLYGREPGSDVFNGIV